jgi:hypothetical protein
MKQLHFFDISRSTTIPQNLNDEVEKKRTYNNSKKKISSKFLFSVRKFNQKSKIGIKSELSENQSWPR